MTPESDAPRRIEVELPAEIFDVAVNVPLIHQVVVAQQAAARQGTASAKTRGEVRGGGRKPYKQKGTGRARQGSTRAPQFTGGGVAHGPKPRDYGQRTPKKMKAAALRGALSDRARANRVHVVEGLVSGPTPSTRAALAALRSLVERDKFLVVLERTDRLTWLSLRNAPSVHLLAVDQLNTYDVLASDDVVFTQGAYKVFVARDEAGREAAPQQATKRVAPQVEAPEVIDSPTSPTDHAAHILQAAHKAAERMDKVMSYRSDDASIDGWSVSSDKIEFVAIERHRDHVLVTWPTTMAAVDAIQFFKSLAAVAVYADGGDDYVEFSAGSRPDWDRIAELDELSFLRVDTGSEILIWEEPEEGHLRDNRFFLIEPAVLASDLLRLIDDTTIRDVAGLLGQFVDMAKLDLQPLVETG